LIKAGILSIKIMIIASSGNPRKDCK